MPPSRSRIIRSRNNILFRFPTGTAINPTMIMFYLFEQ